VESKSTDISEIRGEISSLNSLVPTHKNTLSPITLDLGQTSRQHEY
jgi:hypothetical protein